MREWVAVDAELVSHHKVGRLARALGVGRHEAVGVLVVLWGWAFRRHPDGELGELEPIDIADGIGWTDDAMTLVQALVTAGFLEADDAGRVRIHDWADGGGRLHQARQREADKKRTQRGRPETEQPCPVDVPGTSRGQVRDVPAAAADVPGTLKRERDRDREGEGEREETERQQQQPRAGDLRVVVANDEPAEVMGPLPWEQLDPRRRDVYHEWWRRFPDRHRRDPDFETTELQMVAMLRDNDPEDVKRAIDEILKEPWLLPWPKHVADRLSSARAAREAEPPRLLHLAGGGSEEAWARALERLRASISATTFDLVFARSAVVGEDGDGCVCIGLPTSVAVQQADRQQRSVARAVAGEKALAMGVRFVVAQGGVAS